MDPYIPIHHQNRVFPAKIFPFPQNRIVHQRNSLARKKVSIQCASICCPPTKSVRSVALDRNIFGNTSLLFVLKLKTLILSHPSHSIPVQFLYKFRSYLSLSNSNLSIHQAILRYPSVFQLIRLPNGVDVDSQVCVCFTPEAYAIAERERGIQSANSENLAAKLQKLLMMSSHRRLVLNKLASIAQDLGLPADFRSSFCNQHPSRFRVTDSSYGKAIELVNWDPLLANLLPYLDTSSSRLISDRPLRFNEPKTRKGFTVKRKHRDFLIRFRDTPALSPYSTPASEMPRGSSEAEKRACNVVREVLGMTIGKRTVIDHIAVFRKDFDLPNNLRGMILRHPELFYVSRKGLRDSVFLLEAYDDDGKLREEGEAMNLQNQIARLAAKSKKTKQSRRRGGTICVGQRYDDGLDDVIQSEDSCIYSFDDRSSVFSLNDEPW